MGSQNSPTGLLRVCCLTFSAIILLSSTILAIAFSQVNSASISLVAYNVIVPPLSIIYLIYYYIQRTLYPDVHGKIANPIPLLFSILMSYSWLINAVFWTYCEIYKADGNVCPLGTRLQVMSIFKVVLSWMIVVVFFTHAVVTAMEILNINKAAQQVGKLRLWRGMEEGREAKL
jgi:hypothetical protein